MTQTFSRYPAELIGLVVIVLGFAIDARLGAILAAWLIAWRANVALSAYASPGVRYLVPAIFGATLLGLWELTVQLFDQQPLMGVLPGQPVGR